eukprot:6826228-Pyramimonas_sp.AAC.1
MVARGAAVLYHAPPPGRARSCDRRMAAGPLHVGSPIPAASARAPSAASAKLTTHRIYAHAAGLCAGWPWHDL